MSLFAKYAAGIKSIQAVQQAITKKMKKLRQLAGKNKKKNDTFTQKNPECPIFQAKSSEEQKKVITYADVQFFSQKQAKSKKTSSRAQKNEKK